jgi:hypothetical protein
MIFPIFSYNIAGDDNVQQPQQPEAVLNFGVVSRADVRLFAYKQQAQPVLNFRRCIMERRTAFCLQSAVGGYLGCLSLFKNLWEFSKILAEVFQKRCGSFYKYLREFLEKDAGLFQTAAGCSKLRVVSRADVRLFAYN